MDALSPNDGTALWRLSSANSKRSVSLPISRVFPEKPGNENRNCFIDCGLWIFLLLHIQSLCNLQGKLLC
jgi:hypothetical protein